MSTNADDQKSGHDAEESSRGVPMFLRLEGEEKKDRLQTGPTEQDRLQTGPTEGDRLQAGPTIPTGPNTQTVSTTPPFSFRDVLLAFVLFSIAITLRAWIVSTPHIGHDQDIDLFTRWIAKLCEHGISGFYGVERFCDYPPLMILIFRGLGLITHAIDGGPPGDVLIAAALKTTACAADVLIAIVLIVEGRRRIGPRAGVLAAGLYLLNPISLYDGAFWGQVDSIYTLFVLLALVLLGRSCWIACGSFAAIALTAKFQAITFFPLLLLEAYRIGGWRALAWKLLGIAIGVALIATPLLVAGTLQENFQRAYVNVVGQYHELSKNAYNVWYLVGDPEIADTSPPRALVEAVAAGRDTVKAGDSWLLQATWRKISLAGFALSVAVVLSLYLLRPGHVQRYAAAGLLGMCFYLFPTEMHERYAFPVFAVLAIWAAAAWRNERVYWMLTILLTLNFAAVLPPTPLAQPIAAMTMGVFAMLVIGMLLPRESAVVAADRAPTVREEFSESGTNPLPHGRGSEIADSPSIGHPLPLRLFQVATLLGVVAALWLVAWVVMMVRQAPIKPADPATVWLSSLSPKSVTQGWKELGRDRSVSGGVMHLGQAYYLRGIGTHAPAKMVFEIPAGMTRFEAVVGIDHAAAGMGSAVVRVLLDGREAAVTPTLTGDGEPAALSVALGEARELTIVVDAGRDGKRSDHVNLALARFTVVADAPR
ncbi:MAG: NPCBM/NEW2 domain-containing protein [Phycisphaerae bacterium]